MLHACAHPTLVVRSTVGHATDEHFNGMWVELQSSLLALEEIVQVHTPAERARGDVVGGRTLSLGSPLASSRPIVIAHGSLGHGDPCDNVLSRSLIRSISHHCLAALVHHDQGDDGDPSYGSGCGYRGLEEEEVAAGCMLQRTRTHFCLQELLPSQPTAAADAKATLRAHSQPPQARAPHHPIPKSSSAALPVADECEPIPGERVREGAVLGVELGGMQTLVGLPPHEAAEGCGCRPLDGLPLRELRELTKPQMSEVGALWKHAKLSPSRCESPAGSGGSSPFPPPGAAAGSDGGVAAQGADEGLAEVGDDPPTSVSCSATGEKAASILGGHCCSRSSSSNSCRSSSSVGSPCTANRGAEACAGVEEVSCGRGVPAWKCTAAMRPSHGCGVAGSSSPLVGGFITGR